MDEDIQAYRDFYARYIVASCGSSNERLIAAFAKVRREDFLGPGPWPISTATGYLPTISDDPRHLYQDLVVGLIPDRKINNGQPALHARCLAAIDPLPGENVVHVGAGTGYYTAVLAELVGEGGAVHSYEIEEVLAQHAIAALGDRPHVRVHCRNACEDAIPGTDVIYVNAGVTGLPDAWLDALHIGGRLLAPLTPDAGFGGMLMVKRNAPNAFAARILARVGFIACVGGRNDAESAALAAAFQAGGSENVRSLRRGGDADASAWYVTSNWWLSTRDAEQER